MLKFIFIHGIKMPWDFVQEKLQKYEENLFEV